MEANQPFPSDSPYSRAVPPSLHPLRRRAASRPQLAPSRSLEGTRSRIRAERLTDTQTQSKGCQPPLSLVPPSVCTSDLAPIITGLVHGNGGYVYVVGDFRSRPTLPLFLPRLAGTRTPLPRSTGNQPPSRSTPVATRLKPCPPSVYSRRSPRLIRF